MRWWRCCGGWLLRERPDEAAADAAGLGRQKEYPLKLLAGRRAVVPLVVTNGVSASQRVSAVHRPKPKEVNAGQRYPTPGGGLISVRSVVQLYPGPYWMYLPRMCFGSAGFL